MVLQKGHESAEFGEENGNVLLKRVTVDFVGQQSGPAAGFDVCIEIVDVEGFCRDDAAFGDGAFKDDAGYFLRIT